jgi:hypothetical protein
MERPPVADRRQTLSGVDVTHDIDDTPPVRYWKDANAAGPWVGPAACASASCLPAPDQQVTVNENGSSVSVLPA